MDEKQNAIKKLIDFFKKSLYWNFLSNRKFLNFLLDKKSTYRSEVQRNDSHDSDFFITWEIARFE